MSSSCRRTPVQVIATTEGSGWIAIRTVAIEGQFNLEVGFSMREKVRRVVKKAAGCTLNPKS